MGFIHVLLTATLSASLLPSMAAAEPPAHAKAHGWRKKNDPNYVGYTGKKWEKDYGIATGKCNSAAIGAVLGGAVGGAIGSRAGKEDRPVAIVLGTALGAIIGAKLGQAIDDTDRACMGHSLELAGLKSTVIWTNSATGITYRLTPTRNISEGKQSCRQFTMDVHGGKTSGKEKVTGVACRRANGEWAFRT